MGSRHDHGKNGHADGDTVFNLFEDDRAGAVGGFAVKLDSPVDRTGVHHDKITTHRTESESVKTEKPRILGHRRKEGAILAFSLNTEHVESVAPCQGVIKADEDPYTELFDPLWNQCRWRAQGNFGAKALQGMDI